MKQALFIALLASLAAPVAAQADDLYGGVNLGGARGRIDSNNAQSSSTNAGFKLYGGYQITPMFGAEAGYAYLGKGNVSVNGVDGGHLKPHALYAAGTATLPLNKDFALFAKLGVSANRTTIDMPAGQASVKSSKTSAMFGLGASYTITPALALVAEYENYGKTQNTQLASVKADMLSVGLRYKF